VKAAGPSWVVVERRGRKVFSRGLWAPAEHIETARTVLATERATEGYAKRKESDSRRRERRREREQLAYVEQFESEVLRFLQFSPRWRDLSHAVAQQVTSHATPVGSGTVARTERISVEERAARMQPQARAGRARSPQVTRSNHLLRRRKTCYKLQTPTYT
jgi:hypothetical protein